MHLLTFALTSLLALGPVALAQAPDYSAGRQPAADPALAVLPGGVMLSLPGVHSDFVINGGGQFVELPNGTARLTGRVHSHASLYSAFLVDLEFTGKVEPGQPGHPPAGSPDLQLLAAAYAPAGPVDPSAFVYYTQASGTLVGSSNYRGALLALQLAGGAAQVGLGANNRNGQRGLQAAFQVTVLRQPNYPLVPVGTAELTLDLLPERTDRVAHPAADPNLATLPSGRAMSIPWVANDYVFAPSGSFTEAPDGTATLQGHLLRTTALADGWDLDLQLAGRVDPGESGCPPPGSPLLLLQPSAYAANGGTIDPGHWHYYSTVTGTLNGSGTNAGAVVALQQGNALQCGGGANQLGSFWGFFASLQPTVLSHPAGRILLIGGNIQLHGLCQVFPEFPRPVLTAPSVPYALPTLTDQGVVVAGTDFAWAQTVGVGSHLVQHGDASRWLPGWFEVLDNEHLELHTPPGMAPGTYDLKVFTESSRSNIEHLTLTAPTSPALYAEAAVQALDTLHLRVHQGAITGPAMSALGMSGSLVPTVIPGAATLGIGNQSLELLVVPGSFLHDAATGIAAFDFGPIPPWFTGFVMHFQGLTIDLAAPALPLPATNIWSVAF